MAFSCLVSVASVSGDAQFGLGGFGGPGGYGQAPIAPHGRPLGPVGGFEPAPFGGAPLGGFGGAPGAFGAGIGGFGPAPYGGAIGGFSGGFGAPLGALGLAPYGSPISPAPYGAAPGYAPANYQFGYGVQTDDYHGAASFGHNEERNGYGTNGRYHVNTPASFQSVSYNVPAYGGAYGGGAYGAAPIPAFG